MLHNPAFQSTSVANFTFQSYLVLTDAVEQFFKLESVSNKVASASHLTVSLVDLHRVQNCFTTALQVAQSCDSYVELCSGDIFTLLQHGALGGLVRSTSLKTSP
jgi:hypothetical protein